MAVTPQTNATLADIARELKKHDTFALCGHVSPDGDCLGSLLALAFALESLGKRADVLLATSDPIPADLAFLPGAERLVPAKEYQGSPEAFVACDVPTTERLRDASEVQARAQVKFTIDHHAVPTVMSDFNYVDPDAAAVGILMWDLIKELGVEPTVDMAVCCYVALMTDTGRFQFQNADERAFQAATEMVAAGASPSEASQAVYQSRTLASFKLERRMLERIRVADSGKWVLSYVTVADYSESGAVDADAEILIDSIRSLGGIYTACILRERESVIRGSIRSKVDDIDVAEIAHSLGGGGHKAAAGFTFKGSLEDAIEAVSKAMDKAVAAYDQERA